MTDKTDVVEELARAIWKAEFPNVTWENWVTFCDENPDFRESVHITLSRAFAANAVLDRLIAEAVAEERAAVVAWLKRKRWDSPIATLATKRLATEIERGDHRAPDADREKV